MTAPCKGKQFDKPCDACSGSVWPTCKENGCVGSPVAEAMAYLAKASVDLSKVGKLTRDLPETFLHYTHTPEIQQAIVDKGFSLNRFGASADKFQAQEWAKNDLVGVYATDLEWSGKPENRPWVQFSLTGRPQALVSRFFIFSDLANAYGLKSEELRKALLADGIQVVRSVNEWVILDPSLIRITKARNVAVAAPAHKFGSMQDLLADTRRKMKQRLDISTELAAAGKPVKLYHKSDKRRYALAGVDMSKPGGFRITFFDERGPSNHLEKPTLQLAIAEGLQQGYWPKGMTLATLDKPLPYKWREFTSKTGSALFEVAGVEYAFSYYTGNWNGTPFAVLQYGLSKAGMEKLGVNTTMSPTNLKNPLPVLATVKAACEEYLRTYKPKHVMFYDGDDLAARSKFYDRLARMITQLRYVPDEALAEEAMRKYKKRVWFLHKEGTMAKLKAVASDAYGWWIDEQGKLIEVPRGGHRNVAKQILTERNIETDPEFLKRFDERDFVRKYLGWIRLQRDGDMLQIGIWKNRVAAKAVATLRKFLNEHDEFTDYSLGLRSDDGGGELEKDYDTEGLTRILLPTINKNLVRRVMPQSIIQAATRRLRAHSRVRELSALKWPVLPPAGSKPIPPGHVRLYHQTKAENLPRIKRVGIKLEHARGIEGPRAIYADEKGFYGKPGDVPTVEFHVEIERWQRPFVIGDVAPENIIAIHRAWHDTARYIEDDKKLLGEVMAGKHDRLLNDPQYNKAIRYIKRRHAKGQPTEAKVQHVRQKGRKTVKQELANKISARLARAKQGVPRRLSRLR